MPIRVCLLVLQVLTASGLVLAEDRSLVAASAFNGSAWNRLENIGVLIAREAGGTVREPTLPPQEPRQGALVSMESA
jgi:hypothetical protein